MQNRNFMMSVCNENLLWQGTKAKVGTNSEEESTETTWWGLWLCNWGLTWKRNKFLSKVTCLEI